MKYQQLRAELAAGSIRPAYLFSGREELLAESAIRQLTDRLLAPDERPFNLAIFYGKEADGLPETLATPPLSASRRVTVVRQAQELSARNINAVARYLKHPPPDGCLILQVTGGETRGAALKKLNGLVETVVCDRPRGRELELWMEEYLAKWGKKLDQEAAARLTSVNWPTLHDLAGELERLSLLAEDQLLIRAADIDELGEVSFAFQRWRFTDAVAAGELDAALRVMDNLLRWSVKPTHILGDLQRLFLRLWLISWHLEHRQQQQAQKETGLAPFLFKKYLSFARQTGRPRLEEAIIRIQEAELNIKSGARPDTLELNLLVAELTRKTAPARP